MPTPIVFQLVVSQYNAIYTCICNVVLNELSTVHECTGSPVFSSECYSASRRSSESLLILSNSTSPRRLSSSLAFHPQMLGQVLHTAAGFHLVRPHPVRSAWAQLYFQFQLPVNAPGRQQAPATWVPATHSGASDAVPSASSWSSHLE